MYLMELAPAVNAERRLEGTAHQRLLEAAARRRRSARSPDPKVEALRSLPGVRIGRRAAARVALVLDDVRVPAGTVLRREGHLSHQAFVVVEGVASMTTEGRCARDVVPGDVVGAGAAAAELVSAVTVTARTPMRLLVAGPADLDALGRVIGLPAPAGAGNA